MTEVNINKFEEELVRKGQGREALESMLARFNRAVQTSGIFRELKEHEHYEKPSDKRNRKMREANLRRIRQERKNALHKTDTKGYTRPENKRPFSGTQGNRQGQQRSGYSRSNQLHNNSTANRTVQHQQPNPQEKLQHI